MIVENQTFTAVTIHLDGNMFKGCTFKRCTFVYNALMSVGLESCTFDNCGWAAAGGAANTLQFLSALYKGGGAMTALVEATFDNVRGNPKPGGFGKLN